MSQNTTAQDVSPAAILDIDGLIIGMARPGGDFDPTSDIRLKLRFTLDDAAAALLDAGYVLAGPWRTMPGDRGMVLQALLRSAPTAKDGS